MATDPDGKRRSSPRNPRTPAETGDFPSGYEIAGHHKAPGAEHICRDISDFHLRFEKGGGYDVVLRAIEWIAAARTRGFEWTPDGPRNHGGNPPHDEDGVALPWWVMSSLAGAIQHARRERLSLDKVLGIAGQDGRRTLWQRHDDTAEKAIRAFEVHHLIKEHKRTLDAASEAVADRHGISADLVRRNYREIRRRNPAAFRADPSSGK